MQNLAPDALGQISAPCEDSVMFLLRQPSSCGLGGMIHVRDANNPKTHRKLLQSLNSTP